MKTRDQSEDYVRAEDVMVLRDTGVRGRYAESRAVDEYQLGVAVREAQLRRERATVVHAKRGSHGVPPQVLVAERFSGGLYIHPVAHDSMDDTAGLSGSGGDTYDDNARRFGGSRIG